LSIEIREVRSAKELNAFIRFPHTLYRGHPCWVPLLSMDERNTFRQDKNPAFEHCQARYWLAYRDGKIVGRIAGILNNRHIEKWNQNYLRFSWIDFVDDLEVSKALLETVEAWGREIGLTAVHGPLGFTDMDREGMLVEGFDEMGTMATFYNHPYYPVHLLQHGYIKDIDWVEYEITIPPEPIEEISRMAEVVLRRNNLHVFQPRNKRELLGYAQSLFELLNAEYAHLYGTVMLNQRQIEAYTKEYFSFVSPDLLPIVLDAQNQMVAFGIAMPSLSRALQKTRGRLLPFGIIHLLWALSHNQRADLYLVAIKREYQGKGVNAVLMSQIHKAFIARGIQKAESNPELENNLRVQTQWKYYETRQHKRRRIFIKQLN